MDDTGKIKFCFVMDLSNSMEFVLELSSLRTHPSIFWNYDAYYMAIFKDIFIAL